MELELKDFTTVEIDREAHKVISEISRQTGIKIKFLISQYVMDAIYCREKHLGLEKIKED